MDLVSIARKLIQCPSETAQSNAACSSLLVEWLDERGFEVRTYEYRDMRGCPKVSLAARRPGSRKGDRGIAFFSHSDVVSSDGWQGPQECGPTDGFLGDGKLWGRGACDMKGPIASAIAAIDSLQPSEQTAPIYFFVTGDEECGMVGAELLVRDCPFYREVVESDSAGIITEPTNLRVVSRHKGSCRFRISAHGIAAHSSTPDGINANWQLIPWLNYLATMREQIESDPELRNDDFAQPTLCLNAIVRNVPAEFNITVSHAWCEIFLRTMPSTAWRKWVDEVTQRAREMELEVSAVVSLPPLDTSTSSPIVTQALEIVGQDKPESVGYATDGCRYTDMKNLIVLGPGSIDQAHRPDEWISVEALKEGARVYGKLLEEVMN